MFPFFPFPPLFSHFHLTIISSNSKGATPNCPPTRYATYPQSWSCPFHMTCFVENFYYSCFSSGESRSHLSLTSGAGKDIKFPNFGE